MKRRQALCALIPVALPVAAQRPARIAYLSRRSGPNEFDQSFLRGLREFGLVDGTHFTIDYRWGDGDTRRMEAMAAELVAARPALVFGSDGGAAQMVQKLDPSLPIVMPLMGDPIAQGYTTSLSRPDRNVTGMSAFRSELSGKRVELLKEAVPRLQRVGAVYRASSSQAPALQATHAAAEALGMKVIDMPTELPAGIGATFASAVRQGVQGVLVISDTATISHRAPLCEAARSHRLPAIYSNRTYLRPGGMMSYGPDLERVFHRAAYFADRILKGAKPAELPIEQATEVRLVLQPAIALGVGVTFAPSLLARADEVLA
jgi:putative ABC transport system substrate-binding protein